MKTINPKAVSAAAALALTLGVTGAAHAEYTGSEGMTLLWHFDESGTNPTAVDATGNDYNGTSANGVTGGAASDEGTAYTGFNYVNRTVSSVVVADPVATPGAFTSTNFSFIAWVKNPDLSSGNNALIARGAGNNLGAGKDIPWQVWVSDDGAVNLGVEDWGGHTASYTSDPLTWNQDQWYQVAVVENHSTSGGNHNEAFKVYITPAGSDTVGSPVIDQTYSAAAGLVHGVTLVVGAAQAGYYWYHGASPAASAGKFGGQIDEVSLWLGTTLTIDQLNQSLTSNFVPEPASGALMLVGLGFAARRRRR